MTEVTIIYLPGLGDRFDPLRRWALGGWRSSSRRVELVPMRWDDAGDSLGDKLDRIEQVIDSADGKVVLVGESAGGPVALVALDKFGDQVAGAITICGMNQHADQVRPEIYAKHPAFRQTMRQADEVVATLDATQRDRINIFYSQYDMTIAPKHTLIDGVRAHRVLVPGHMLAITSLITIFRRRIISSIKT